MNIARRNKVVAEGGIGEAYWRVTEAYWAGWYYWDAMRRGRDDKVGGVERNQERAERLAREAAATMAGKEQ